MEYLQHTSETSLTLENIRLQHVVQQDMAARRVEHGTVGSGCAVAVEKEDGSGQAVVRPLVSGCAASGDRAHMVPAVEVKAAVGWCGLAR